MELNQVEKQITEKLENAIENFLNGPYINQGRYMEDIDFLLGILIKISQYKKNHPLKK